MSARAHTRFRLKDSLYSRLHSVILKARKAKRGEATATVSKEEEDGERGVRNWTQEPLTSPSGNGTQLSETLPLMNHTLTAYSKTYGGLTQRERKRERERERENSHY